MKRLLFLALLATAPVFAGETTQPFRTGSMSSIVAAHRGQALALAIWSLDCLHCPKELQLLAAAKKRHPFLRLVLIATEDLAQRADIEARLRELGLAEASSWAFDDPVPERLRHDIDPGWRGELPRTYFIGRDGRREAVSGVVTEAKLGAWLAANDR